MQALLLVLSASLAATIAFPAPRAPARQDVSGEERARQREELRTALVALGEAQEAGDRARMRELSRAAIERALPLLEDAPPTWLVDLCGKLGGFLYDEGELLGARRAFQAVLEIRESTLQVDHPELQAARQSLAMSLHALGELGEALPLFESVLEARARTLPVHHAELQAARQNLGVLLASLGDLLGARAQFEAVLAARGRTLPADHLDLQRARANLAATMFLLGDVRGARALQEVVLEVGERTLAPDDPDLQRARQNLAGTLAELGDLENARTLQEVVLEVRERTFRPDHPELQAARQNLALTLHSLGEREVALSLQRSVLDVRERTLRADHPDLLRARGDLAAMLVSAGEFDSARPLLEAVLQVGEQALPDDHPALQDARRDLARTIAHRALAGPPEERERERERCIELTQEHGRAQLEAARLALWTSSPREAGARCVEIARSLGLLLSFAQGYGPFEPSATLHELAFALSETTRAAALAAAANTRRALGSPEHVRWRQELREAGRALAEFAQQGASREALHEARERKEALERESAQLALSLEGGASPSLPLEPRSLAARIGAGTALVGLRRYARRWLEVVEPAGTSGEARIEVRGGEHLGAFVILRDPESKEPRLTFVDLGPLAPIEQLVGAWRAAIQAPTERGVGIEGAEETRLTELGSGLRRAVWDPLRPWVDASERVILAPDDVLHLVPLDALPLAEEGRFVGDRWRIETRVVLWEVLAESPEARPEGGTLVALGGASFNSRPTALGEQERALLAPAAGGSSGPARTRAASSLASGGAWERSFVPLTYTAPEARGVAALFAEAHGEAGRSLVLEGPSASREALEQAAPQARFLHVATHGWFAPESVPSWSEAQAGFDPWTPALRASPTDVLRGLNPMLLSGLALAGANLPADALGRVPGLITAEELSTFDLSGCELAVLSACDTNVGERRAGQGVEGLQKALHMAGARSAITSLWKVPDEATRELMLDFYRRIWVEEKPKAQALWEAKKRLREARDERGMARYTTRDWAAWVLTGAPD